MKRISGFSHEGGELLGCGDAELYVECLGPRDAPVLLMLHGGFGSIEDFGPICGELSRDYRLVGVDSRGHGRSTLGEAALSYARLRGDLEALIARLGLESYAILGFSDGGIAAYRHAAARPAGLRGLVTIGSSWELSEEDRVYGMLKGMTPKLWKRLFPESVRRYEELQPGADWPAFAERVLAMWRDLGPTGHPGASVKRISLPFLAIRGEEDRLTSLESLARLRTLNKKAMILNLPFADHAAFEEEPEILVRMIRKYLSGRFAAAGVS
ncbi:MAG TPA: alpha/beta hydrolase [Spirochaetales bacterium]|nr:alpha/beta hydrolase [Spirochaetales bacterium]HRY53261.1 alpha/beta hydrolase [Spirochaetia bacterium]HRZ65156.1 alpha/beta hydrolase [Spirochaetia bacterium]